MEGKAAEPNEKTRRNKRRRFTALPLGKICSMQAKAKNNY
jgi:hypothetical protein